MNIKIIVAKDIEEFQTGVFCLIVGESKNFKISDIPELLIKVRELVFEKPKKYRLTFKSENFEFETHFCAEEIHYSGFINCKKCGYEDSMTCFISEISKQLKGELPDKELVGFLRKIYDKDSIFQQFEINGKKVRFVIS